MDIVVCALGALVEPWHLPASTLLEREWIHGGERTMYELAAAAALQGHRVELRGDISRRDYEQIVAATGASISTSLPPRRPRAGEVVLTPEGINEPLHYAGVALSAARAVMVLLGPPGLFGPALDPAFVRPDPLTVDLSSVGTPAGYRIIRDSGFELWTNAPAIAAEARAAGVECEFLGTGQPLPLPAPGPKTHDVAFVGANRWAPAARVVAKRLNCRVLEVGGGDRDSVVTAIASSRMLLLPARIEGQSRLQLEARAVGTVPVALSSNRYAAGMDEDGGAVLVGSVEEMVLVVDELLEDPGRLADLSARAISSAHAQTDWTGFVTNVQKALERPIRMPDPFFRRAAGAAIDAMVRELRREGHQLAGELAEVESRLAAAIDQTNQLAGELAEAESRLAAAIDEGTRLQGLVEQQVGVIGDLEAARRRRSVRIALWFADRLGPFVRFFRYRRRER